MITFLTFLIIIILVILLADIVLNHDEWLVFPFLFGLFCCFVLYAQGKKEVQIDAIKNGVGEWVISKDGDTSFRWIVPDNKKP